MFSLPIKLVVTIALAFLLSDALSGHWVAGFYTISVLLKDILMLVLPFIIFSYLASAILNLKGKATFLIFGIFGLVIISNTLSVLVAYFTACSFAEYLPATLHNHLTASTVNILPLWKLPITNLTTPDKAMILGIISGFVCNFFHLDKLSYGIVQIKNYSTMLINKLFVPFLPFYVFGFTLKIGFEGSLKTMAASYAPVFFMNLAVVNIYIFIFYFVGNNAKITLTIQAIKNMIPAWITGFSTMSSAATLPVTIECVEKNIHNQKMSHITMPATANIHMIGDGINITLTSLALLMISGSHLPSFVEFLPYLWTYVFTKFSGSGVPGGGMIILLPVVEQHLGLSQELSSMVATLYIMQDSLMTASNVMGNGALAIIANKVFKQFKIMS